MRGLFVVPGDGHSLTFAESKLAVCYLTSVKARQMNVQTKTKQTNFFIFVSFSKFKNLILSFLVVPLI